MISTVSQAFKDKLNNGEVPSIRMQFIPATGQAFWLSDGDFWSGGISFSEATSNQGEFSVGAAVIGSFSFTLNNFDGNLTDEVFRGAMVIPLLYFVINGEPEYLGKGVYYIASHRTVGNIIKCTAYDGMKLLDEHKTAITYPITVQNLITTICAANSITLATPTIPNGSFSIATAPSESLTDRQMLSYACQITGNFAKMDELGYMQVGWYDESHPVPIEHTFDGKDLWTNEITITGVRGYAPSATEGSTEEVTALYGTADCAVVIRDNPYITASNLQAVVNMVGQRIVGGTFRPGTLPILSNPCIQAGDVLVVEDNITHNEYYLYATELTYSKQIVEIVTCNFQAEAENDIRPTVESRARTSIEEAKQQATQAANLATAAGASAVQAAAAAAVADQKAQDATASAAEAKEAADLADAKAEQAVISARNAQISADNAQDSADAAQESAVEANTHANSALTQLSVVEDVAGTLDWISQHGSYAPTSDTTVLLNKVYFKFESGAYVPVVLPDQSANPSEEGWYELDISDSQSEYIMAHLAVTTEGLWVLPSGSFVRHYLIDSSGNRIVDSNGDYIVDYSFDPNSSDGYKILLSNTGMSVYNDAGAQIAEYSGTIRIGVATQRNIHIDTDSVDIRNGSVVLAQFLDDKVIFNDGDGNVVAEYGKDRIYMSVSGIPVFDINSTGETDNMLVRKNYEPDWRTVVSDEYRSLYYPMDIDDIVPGEKIHLRLDLKLGTYSPRVELDITQSLNVEETFEINQFTFKTMLFPWYDTTRLRISAITSDSSHEPGFYKFSLTYIVYKATAYAPSFSLGTRIDSAESNGAFSLIVGEGLISRTNDQLVVGKYNREDTDGNYAIMVGNGSSFTNRKTTHGVTWDGDEELYLGNTQIDNALDAAISALGWDNDVAGLGVYMLSIKKLLTKIVQSLPQYQWKATEATITVGASAGYTHTFTDITMPAKSGWGRQIIARCSNDKVALCGWTWDSDNHPQIIVRNLTTSGTGVVVRVCCLYLRNENIFT